MPSILFDLDGVFYQGDRAIAGAADVVAWARDAIIPHLFVTNTTSRPRSALIEKLAGFGIEVRREQIFTPAVAAVHWLEQQCPEQKVALFIPEATQVEFNQISLSNNEDDDVCAVVIGDLGEQWDFKTLNRAFRLLMQGNQPQLLALGMTRYWQAADGLQLDVAPFVMALSHASGVEPQVLGKPAQLFYQAALDLLGVSAGQTVMIGDDIVSDVGGAQHAGLRGLLVRTGKFRPQVLQGEIVPDAVLDSVRDLPEWWQQHKRDS